MKARSERSSRSDSSPLASSATAASNVRKGHLAVRDATVIQRLREAGAVILGKTNLHEFALGTTSEESAFGPVHNPHDPTRSAGGSSGGSAAAVATGMGQASIGTDTGGSIRIPAAACGVVGLKPSLGEVPTDGVVPLCPTFDRVGPITRSVEDAAALWSVLAARPLPRLGALARSPIMLGALGGYFTALLDGDVRRAFDSTLARLRASGIAIESRAVQGSERIVDTYVNISLPEAAQYHAPTLDARASDYQPAVRERLLKGRTISAVDYLAARDGRDSAASRGRCRARTLRRFGASDAADRRPQARRQRSHDGQWADAPRPRRDAAAHAVVQHHGASGDLTADSNVGLARRAAVGGASGRNRGVARGRGAGVSRRGLNAVPSDGWL